MGWDSVIPSLEETDRKKIIEEVSGQLATLSIGEMRGDREKLIVRVTPLVQSAISRMGLQVSSDQAYDLARDVVARVGGLGFLEPLLRIDAELSEIAVTPDGGVWVLRKGAPAFEKLPNVPSRTDVWRAVETLLAPLGRAVTEASPRWMPRSRARKDCPAGRGSRSSIPSSRPGTGIRVSTFACSRRSRFRPNS